MNLDEIKMKGLEDLKKEWAKGSMNSKALEKEIFAQLGKVKCGVIDKYEIVIVPKPFKSDGLLMIETPEGEKRVQVNLIYKDVKFETTFPMQRQVTMVWIAEVDE